MPRIAVSAGDPAGIGPEVTLAATRAFVSEQTRIDVLIFGDQASLTGLDDLGERVEVRSIPCKTPPIPGQPNGDNASHVIALIEAAVAAVLQGEAKALVTAPIAKSVLYGAGFGFPGHTEFLGHLAGGVQTHMMLASDSLRVVPVTLHQSLASAITGLSSAKIIDAARATHWALKQRFNIASPRLVVCGLNPHAGENGSMGQEDEDLIRPAVETLRAEGMDIRGPLPADTLFHAKARATYDCALGMYHDQVLIPIKALAFDSAVNVTLGLPFIRTSPDHGTAFDIAGKGLADPSSMLSAMHLAADLVL